MIFLHILTLIIGAALILTGANFMTSGATTVAKRFGVSDFVIGLTLVAFGSSAPDLAVGVLSALKGHTQFAIGNVVGSDIFDGWLVTGCVALVAPFAVSAKVREIQLPMLLMAFIVIIVCANSICFDGMKENVITRGDGILMLIIFALMMWMSLRRGQTASQAAKPVKSPEEKEKVKEKVKERLSNRQVLIVVLQIAGGLGALVLGGDLFVDGASGVAKEAHMSETLIGLTVVALGTSLPDLATSVVAAYRHRPGMAIGNVVGSCLFDALLVLGCSAVVCPLPMDGVNNIDLSVLFCGGAFFWIVSIIRRSHTVSRWVGAFMVAVYVGYIVYLIMK